MPQRAKLRRHRQTKIVATLGPASASAGDDRAPVPHRRRRVPAELLPRHACRPRRQRGACVRALEAGDRPADRAAGGRAGAEAAGRPLHGRSGASEHRPGLHLRCRPHAGQCAAGAVAASGIISAARPSGTMLLLDDGKLRLRVDRNRGGHLECEVVTGGPLSDRKGVNVPDVIAAYPGADGEGPARPGVCAGPGRGFDRAELRAACRPTWPRRARSLNGRAWIVSKIEKPQALDAAGRRSWRCLTR